ncbi:MAG TPA: HalOD1 output domain-containing protein, partial [Natronoarchaeum rubrum]|nr:HalOD1 output domain-containing protein [Natronoarchaeum rubrum]
MTSGDQQDRRSTITYVCGPDEPLSRGVVEAVAEAAGTAPTPDAATDGDAALEPLYLAVDPEALDSLFRST